MAKKPSYALKNNRWLYVGFVALGVMAVWFGVLLGNFLLDKVADADALPKGNEIVSPENEKENGVEDTKEPSTTVSVDFPDLMTPNIGGGLYRVRVGTFSTLTQARSTEAALQASGIETYVIGTGSGPYYVQVGAFRERANAEALKTELETKGYNVYIMQ